MTLPNGIYFGLSFEEYQRIERLSKTRLKQIVTSPADFWADSWLNPNPIKLTPEQEKRRKIALLLGKAYHCARLEPEDFHDRFVRELSQADFADDKRFLSNATAIEEALADIGAPKKTASDGGVLGQAQRLKSLGYEGPIWHVELAAWEAERGERIAVPAEAFDQIVIDMARIDAVPEVREAMSNGFAEVSILYDCPETGLPMKARLDWLRADGFVEFKSFANPRRKPVEQALLDAIRYDGYYIDVAAYQEATEAIRVGGLEAIGTASEVSPDQLALVAAIKDRKTPLGHRLIFQQKGGVPNVLSRTLRLFDNLDAVDELRRDGATEDRIAKAEAYAERATPQPTLLMMKARGQIKRAKRTFIGYSEIYAPGEPWLPFDPHREISDLDFHPSFLESY